MLSKVYEKIKKFIKENYLYLTSYFVILAVLFYPLPYYVYNGGGLISVDERIEVENGYSQKGSFHLCYVSEVQATLPTYVLAHILPDWELTKFEDVALSENETEEDMFLRDRLFMSRGNTNAIQLAYKKAGKTFEITNVKNNVIYVDDKADTSLKVGDNIQKVNGKEIDEFLTISELVPEIKAGDEVTLTVIRDNKEKEVSATVYEEDNKFYLGIGLQYDYEYETDPEIKLSFSENESGSSGGLVLTLSIYNQLVEEDITHGLKIAGTGTIESDGTVGPIGGVKFKLAGAVKEKADIFFVPNGENYEEAIKEKKEHDYEIKIIGVSTFNEAVEVLEKLKS